MPSLETRPLEGKCPREGPSIGDPGKMGEAGLGGLDIRRDTGERGGVGGGVGGPPASQVKCETLMFGPTKWPGFAIKESLRDGGGTPEFQLDKHLVSERGRDLDLILDGPLAQYI